MSGFPHDPDSRRYYVLVDVEAEDIDPDFRDYRLLNRPAAAELNAQLQASGKNLRWVPDPSGP